MVAKTDLKARLFDLVACIMELVRDEKRDAEEVCLVLQAIKDNKRFRQANVRLPDVVTPCALKRAKDIMGDNCILPEEVEKHLRVEYSEKELESLSAVPWSEETLESLKDTHILLPGHPLSILEIREKAPKKTFYSYGDAWYNDQPFAMKEKVELRWYLIRKDIQPNSTSKTYQEQLATLSRDEENPRAVEMVYAMTLYWLARKEKLFTDYWARCRDLDSDGSRVFVSFFDGGLYVNYDWGDSRYDYVGVASSRKFQS
jgi:hypothetical protein